jgi:hypothetical protein
MSEKNKQKGYIPSEYQKAFNKYQKWIARVAGTYIYNLYIFYFLASYSILLRGL